MIDGRLATAIQLDRPTAPADLALLLQGRYTPGRVSRQSDRGKYKTR
jgi:hypothetical protein